MRDTKKFSPPTSNFTHYFITKTLRFNDKYKNKMSATSLDCTFMGCSKLTTISNIPKGVTNMSRTFNECTSFKTAPNIPAGVEDMRATFNGCTNLQTASPIPTSVINMDCTFAICPKLTGTLEINASPTSYERCLSGVSTDASGSTCTYRK